MQPALSTTTHALPAQGRWYHAPLHGAALMLLAMASHFAPDGHDDQRMLQLLALAAGALWLFWRPGLAAAPLAMRSRCLLALFFLLGFVSSGLAFSPSHGFAETGMLYMLLLLALAAAGGMRRDYPSALAIVLKVAVVGCSFHLAGLAVSYAMLIAIPLPMNYTHFIAGFSNYRFFNHAQTILLPLIVLWCSRTGNSRAGSALAIGLTSLYWAMLFATGGRGTMLGLAAGACAVLLIQRRQGLRYLKFMAATAVVGIALFWLLFYVVPVTLGMAPFLLNGLIDRTVEDPTSSRLPLWKHAWELILAHPFFGIGPLHFAHAGAIPQGASHPHNFLLQVGAEWGLPALVCLCALIARASGKMVCHVRQVDAGDTANIAIGSALILGGAAILVDGLVSGLLVMPVSQVLIALYIGCAMGWVQSGRAAKHNATGRPARLIIRGSIAAAALAVAALMTVELPAMLSARSSQVIVESTFVFKPRLWRDGRF